MTISATTAMTTISEKPMSNIGGGDRHARGCRPGGPRRARRTCSLRRAWSFFTSPSIVVPRSAAAASAGARRRVGLASVFMPSLKPLTAPPRSCPMLRSFFVPKISTTTSRTISQCQMLNTAHGRSPQFVASARAIIAAERLGAADDVHVDVHDVLPADAAGVDDRAKAVRRPCSRASRPASAMILPEHRRVVRRRRRRATRCAASGSA